MTLSTNCSKFFCHYLRSLLMQEVGENARIPSKHTYSTPSIPLRSFVLEEFLPIWLLSSKPSTNLLKKHLVYSFTGTIMSTWHLSNTQYFSSFTTIKCRRFSGFDFCFVGSSMLQIISNVHGFVGIFLRAKRFVSC